MPYLFKGKAGSFDINSAFNWRERTGSGFFAGMKRTDSGLFDVMPGDCGNAYIY